MDYAPNHKYRNGGQGEEFEGEILFLTKAI